MGRYLAAAAIAVIALLAGLWFLMHDSDDSVAAAPSSDPAPIAVAPTTPPDVVDPWATTRAIVSPVMRERPTQGLAATPSTDGATAPTLTEDAPARPPTMAEVLEEQVLVTETQVLECNDKALKAGVRLDGEAAFGFTVARKNGKIVVESTGVEYTPFDGPTSDCIRETAHAMTFDSLPDGVEALTGYRKVVFNDGKLTREWMTEYAVIRPPQPPPAR